MVFHFPFSIFHFHRWYRLVPPTGTKGPLVRAATGRGPGATFSTGWWHQPVPKPLWYRFVVATGTKGWFWRGHLGVSSPKFWQNDEPRLRAPLTANDEPQAKCCRVVPLLAVLPPCPPRRVA